MPLNWPSISLIIPCYNEDTRLKVLHDQLLMFTEKYLGEIEIVLVNDGSTDRTGIQLNKLKQESPIAAKLLIVEYKENQGKGFALQYGIGLAKGDFLITMDADLSAHPTIWIDWFTKNNITEDRIWIASREHAESIIDALEIRKWSGRFFNYWIRFLTGLRIRDTQCGFKCYPTKIGKVLFSGLKNMGWAHDVEILYRAKKLNIPIETLPLTWKHVENSKLSLFKDGISSALDVWKIKRTVDKEFK